MGDLGRTLALLQSAHRRFRTFHGLGSRRYDPRVRYRLRDRVVGDGRRGPSVVGSREEGVAEVVARLWVEPFRRLRAEQDGRRPGQRPGSYLTVVDGQRWWTYSPEWGARYGEGTPSSMAPFTVTDFEWLLDPRGVLSGMCDVVCGGSAVVAGREGVVLRPHGRGSYERWVDRELVVDAERGIVLRLVDRFNGELVELFEFSSVAFDEPLSDEVFTFAPPPGEVPLPLPEGQAVTAEEAARTADFTVYVPASVPEGWQQRIDFWPGWQREGLPGARVRVTLTGADAFMLLQEYEGYGCDHGDLDWQHVRRGGDDLLVATDDQGSTHIRVRKGDTSVELWAVGHSSVDVAEKAVTLAACLVPADATTDLFPGLLQSPEGEARLSVPAAASVPTAQPHDWIPPPAPLATDPPAELCRLFTLLYGRGRRFGNLRARVQQWNRDDAPHTTSADIAVGDTTPDLDDEVAYEPPVSLDDPSALFAVFDIDVVDSCDLGTRSGVRLLAKRGLPLLTFPAVADHHGALRFDPLLEAAFFGGAQRWELVVDCERAILLRVRAYVDTQMVAAVEVKDPVFDDPA